MSTTHTLDTVDLVPSAPVNLRDLGGIPIIGGTVRDGFAVRADDLTIITEDDACRLVDGGLRTVIDLRSGAEFALTGRGPLGTRPEVNYHHLPFLSDIDQDATGTGDLDDMVDQRRFAPLYLRMYERAAPQIVAALAIMAFAPGTVAFHCAAGQDRTGVLAAALLLALGAEQDDIVADYTRTGENTAAIMDRIAPLMRPLMSRFGLDLDDALPAAVRADFSPAPMRELIAVLTDRHGDPLAPLRAAGLTDHLVARLRERALTAP